MRNAEALLDQHRDAFQRYFELLTEWNERVNLTAITSEQEVFAKHFLDSLLVVETAEWLDVVRAGGTVIDMGTGAGFPGLPLAVAHPELSFTLCDAVQKKVQFVRTVCGELGLDNVEVVHGRSEDLARDPAFRQRFDAAVARAVARLNVLAELTLPFVHPGGYLFSYKGPGAAEEETDGRRAAQILGAEICGHYRSQLPDGLGERTLIVFRQNARISDRYPRKAGTPQKKPL